MILLDTHILIWWVNNPDQLTKKAKSAIKKAKKQHEILMSSMSVWEISMLVKTKRLKLTMNLDSWLDAIYQLSYLKFIPIDNQIAKTSVFLPKPLHKDPADRIIIATALNKGAILITSDEKILSYPHVHTLWN